MDTGGSDRCSRRPASSPAFPTRRRSFRKCFARRCIRCSWRCCTSCSASTSCPVALAQTVLFVLICIVVYAMARRVASEPVAIGAAAATALFPAIPYFGALVMTEVLTTLLFTVSMWLAVSALADRGLGRFAWLGVLLALTTLSRPVFVLFPFALAAVGLVVFPLLRVRARPRARAVERDARGLRTDDGAVVRVQLRDARPLHALPGRRRRPRTVGRIMAGHVVRPHCRTSSRIWPTTSTIAPSSIDASTAVAAREQLPAAPMLDYVHQWEDIRLIWTEPTDPLRARDRARQGRRRIPARRHREHPARRARAPGQTARARSVHPVGGRNPVPLQRDQRPVDRDDSRLLGDSGAHLPGRAVRRLRSVCAADASPRAWSCWRRFSTSRRCIFRCSPKRGNRCRRSRSCSLLAAVGAAWLIGHSLPLEPQVHERQHL